MRSDPADITVLIVEDHEDSLHALAHWFRSRGYETHLCSSVEDSLALVEKTPFELLICDLQLPDGTGWDLMRQLCTKRTFVGIAMSGHGSGADVEKSRAAGFLTHITKPYTSQDLREAVDLALADINRRRGSEGPPS